MFDGNFRSGRRQMNLGSAGARRRAAAEVPKSKQALVRTAQIQRQQRQERQRHIKAATVWQRWSRGYLSRKHLSIALEVEWSAQAQNKNPADQIRLTKITAMRVSPWLRRFLIPSRVEMLTGYVDMAGTLQAPSDESSLWFSQMRIAMTSLIELRPTLSSSPAQFKAVLCILESYFSTLPPKACTADLLIEIASSIQPWWHDSFKPRLSDDQKRSAQATTRTMCQWFLKTSEGFSAQTETPATNVFSLLISVLIGTIADIFQSKQRANFSQALPSSMLSEDYYTAWFLPLSETLASSPDPSLSPDNAAKTKLKSSAQSYFQKNEIVVLSNILDLFQSSSSAKSASANSPSQPKPYALIQLFHHVLRERPDLATMASFVVRGENLADLASSAAANDASNHQDGDDDFDSDEDWESNNTSATQKKARGESSTSSSYSRYTRQNLLTLVKLDQLYQNDVLQQLRNTTAQIRSGENNKPSKILPMAQKVGSSAETWRRWGLQLFNDTAAETSPDLVLAQDSYMAVLNILLKFTTSLRHNSRGSSSQFLSQMAFHRDFLESLWMYVGSDKSSFGSLSVFCDIFSHYLIALSDVEFLRFHTTLSVDALGVQANMITDNSILANDVIVRLRDALYELYWEKPVIVSEVRLAAAGSSANTDDGRGRLLLSGTKLYNSLHERWTRLVRQAPFCEESIWWFPRLSSREGTTAVISHRENDAPGNEEDGDNMLSSGMDVDMDDDDSDDYQMDTGFELSAADEETNELGSSFRDPKMARVLTCIPQALPFDRRVKLFDALLTADKSKTQDESEVFQRAILRMQQEMNDDDDENPVDIPDPRAQVRIRRDNLYDDSMDQLNSLGPNLKRRVIVSFVNQHGAEEAGIDGGGVFKEFLDDLIKNAFEVEPNDGDDAPPRLFSVTPMQALVVNPAVEQYHKHKMLNHYEFLGRVMGKALYESILVEPQFCLPFLNQLLGKLNSLEDLKNLDEEYYKNLTKLRSLTAADIDSLSLTFELTVGDTHSKGGPQTIELIPGGRTITVTKQNVIRYIHLVAHYRLNVQGRQQTKAFLRGFRDLIPASWVRLFSANELQKLIGGDDSVRGIDVDSLEKAMQYGAGYHPSQQVMKNFWAILHEDLSAEQLRKFLKFMTSCSRQPLLGFSSLEPAPCIQQIRLSDQEASDRNSRLPTSATCMNLLKLPNYASRSLMRDKLIAAIEAGAGFELS